MLKRLLFITLIFINLTAFAKPLSADMAFQISTKPIDPNTLQIEWKITNKYFLYKNSLKIINTKNSDVKIGNISYPNTQEKTNREGQHYPVYYSNLSLIVPILSAKPGENLIKVRYQGCSDEGFCYPPEKKWIKITTNTQLAMIDANIETMQPQKTSKINVPKETDFQLLFSSNNWPLIVLSFFSFGLLLSFTPCVLPMVPVLSSIIIGHGHKISTKKAFLLSLSYVLSMSVTYGIIGAVIAMLGSNLQILMQSPWIITAFSIVFIILALSMFNFYELKFPISWQTSLAKITRSQSGGHYLSSIILGSMSILILSPCVSAPLIGALSYIAQTGDMALGLLSLFFLSFGMGIPLLLIGTSAGKLLPKAGAWMNMVKILFGVILIAVAISLISRLLPPVLSMLLWSSLCIFTGVYLKPFGIIATNQDKFKQGFAILFLGYGLFILYGASSGHTNPLIPLQDPVNYTNSSKFKTKTLIVDNIKETLEALKDSKNNSTPVMVYFYADWCSSCNIISSTILQEESILNELQHVLMIKVDLTKNNNNTKELLSYFKVIAPPTFIFYDKEGNKLENQLVGSVSSQTLLKQLKDQS